VALKLPGQWVWDSWFVFDGERHHAFYLQASRALGDPERRHNNPSIGHAVSDDLTNWTVLPDALIYSDAPAPDDYTTWTGSVVKGDDGLWWMFYTGRTRENKGFRQTVVAATSEDLITWTKRPENPLVVADENYQTLAKGFEDEPFRDPWVFKMAGESQWTMLVTATAPKHEKFREQGVIAMAKSDDLINWRLMPPQAGPDQGFGETEVLQYEVVDGVPILLFCCGTHWISEERMVFDRQGGLYSLPTNEKLTEIDLRKSVRFDADDLYASRLVQGKDGKWNLIAFINYVDGKFVGELCDPIPVTADPVRGLIRR
jgi:beta-fructofuranosidase